jgi:hypothetical protein
MHPYLRHALYWLFVSLLVALLWFLSGCASTSPVCRHYATLGAVTDAEVFPVRVWWGTSSDPAGHNQHQAYINGEWVWRCVGINSVYTCHQDNFKPIKAIPYDQWMRGIANRKMKGEGK